MGLGADGGVDRRVDEGKWRTGWDSNPRWACTHAGFQDQSLKPLGHLSVWEVPLAARRPAVQGPRQSDLHSPAILPICGHAALAFQTWYSVPFPRFIGDGADDLGQFGRRPGPDRG